MADSNIILRIKSLFSGEGFDKAQAAVKEANAHMSKGVGEANKLAGALGGVDTSASQTARSASTLVSAFAQGGVQGAAFSAAVMALNSYLKKCQEEIAAVKKETEELDKKMSTAFSDALNGRINASVESAKALGTAFESVQKHAEAASKAFAGLEAAKDAAGVMQLQIDKFNATVNEADEVIRRRIEAEYDLKIAEERLANIEAQGADNVEAARQAYLTNLDRVNTIESQMAAIDERIAREKENANAIRQADEKKSDEILKAVARLEEQRRDLVQKHNDAVAASTALEVKWQTVSQENQNAIAAQTLQVKKTEAELVEYEKKAREAKLALEGPDADSGSLDDLLKKVDEVQGWIDAPSEEIKASVDKAKDVIDGNLRSDVDALKRNQGKIAANQSVNAKIDPNPGVIPSPEEVKRAREASEKAPYVMLRGLESKWSTWGTSFVRMMNEGRYGEAVASGKFSDLFSVLNGLPLEIEAKFWQNAASHIQLRSEYKEYFDNTQRLLEDIATRRDGEGADTSGQTPPAGNSGGESGAGGFTASLEGPDLGSIEAKLDTLISSVKGTAETITALKDALLDCVSIR